MTPLQKLPKTVGDLSKIIVAKGFKKSPKVQKLPNLVTLVTGNLFVGISYVDAKVTQKHELNKRHEAR